MFTSMNELGNQGKLDEETHISSTLSNNESPYRNQDLHLEKCQLTHEIMLKNKKLTGNTVLTNHDRNNSLQNYRRTTISTNQKPQNSQEVNHQ